MALTTQASLVFLSPLAIHYMGVETFEQARIKLCSWWGRVTQLRQEWEVRRWMMYGGILVSIDGLDGKYFASCNVVASCKTKNVPHGTVRIEQ